MISTESPSRTLPSDEFGSSGILLSPRPPAVVVHFSKNCPKLSKADAALNATANRGRRSGPAATAEPFRGSTTSFMYGCNRGKRSTVRSDKDDDWHDDDDDLSIRVPTVADTTELGDEALADPEIRCPPDSYQGSKVGSRNPSPLPTTSMNKYSSAAADSISDFPREGSEEAPVGYAQCESGEISPYSEHATPTYMKWAVDLHYILEDFEGLQLFKKFLLSEGAANELDFWYACKGLKQYSPKEQNLIERLVQIIYQNYVRSQGECCVCCLQSETRIECHSRFVNKDIAQNMFDKAQQEVEAFLRIKHAAFVESELYITYLQSVQAGGWDSPKCYSNESNSNSSSNSGDAQRPSSTLLPTVQEEPDVEPDQDQRGCGSSGENVLSEDSPSGGSGQRVVGEEAPSKAASDHTTKEKAAVATTKELLPSPSLPITAIASAACDASSSAAIRSCKKSVQTTPALSQPSRLTAGALVATLEQRMAYTAKRSNRSGVPPNPYHTQYVPYLPTSAQDSELQSMSSDAATENSISNSRYRHKDRRIMRQHTEQNRDPMSNQIFIPRTQREVVARDMMDDSFKSQVFEKLEYLRREQERDEKLKESLKRLSEPENNSNSHRAAVEKFCKVEKSFRAPPEDAEAILDDYYSRVGWKDSPRQSPLRSPGCVLGSRRKSPMSKSPDRRGLNRWMTPSYPLPYQAMIQAVPTVSLKSTSAAAVAASAVPDHSGFNVTLPTGGHSASKHRGGVPHNTLPSSHRSRVDPTTAQRTAGPSKIAKQFFYRCPGTTSDTSGISSGTSSDPSLVNAKLSATNAGAGMNRSSEHWILDERMSAVHLSGGVSGGDYEENAKQHKQRISPSSMPSSNSSSSNGRTHKSGYHKSTSSETSHKMFFSDKSTGKVHKCMYPSDSSAASASANQRKACSSKSGGGVAPAYAAGGYPQTNCGSSSSSTQDHISVGYFLPNESTPYVTRFSGRQITLRQFKQLVPRKGNFRYFFQCASDELGTGMVQREVIDENEILPLWEGNKIVAKIVCID